MAMETTATGKWVQAGVPHKGWSCVDIEELEEQEHLCEMCEARRARKREAGFKNERGRRTRWLSREWRISASGNQFLNTNDGFNVVVYPKGPIWG